MSAGVAALSQTAAAWTWDDAEAALAAALRFGVNPSLEPVRAMCEVLGRPQDTFAVVQVTGTNGKSSVARMTAALLAAHGVRTGLYTSPHLMSYAERFDVSGSDALTRQFEDLGMEEVAFDAVKAVPAAIGMAVEAAAEAGVTPTEFELLTVGALWLFAQQDVHIAVLEVGLGGKWDATSVTSPAVAVITGVGLDHTDRLGETVEEIAADKAQIIKRGSLALLGPGVGPEAVPPIRERADAIDVYVRAVVPARTWSPADAELTSAFVVTDRPDRPGGSTRFDLTGAHGEYTGVTVLGPSFQAPNAATAIVAAECALGRALDPEAIHAALSGLVIAGRFQLAAIDPPLVVDGAHNPQAAAVLAGAVEEAWPDPAHRPVVVLGMLADKDAAGVVAALAPVAAGFVVTGPRAERALPAQELARLVAQETGVEPVVVEGVAAAMVRAWEGTEDGVLVTGSLYTVGEALSALGYATPTRRP